MEQPNQRNSELNAWIDGISNKDLKLYIQSRVLRQMQFYSEKSRSCKSLYFQWMNTSIVISVMIPIASIFSDGSILMKAVIAALGAAIAAITSYLSLHNYKDLWGTYRSAREQTYSVLLFYFTSSGIFANKQPEEQDRLLIESCERIFNKENQSWIEALFGSGRICHLEPSRKSQS